MLNKITRYLLLTLALVVLITACQAKEPEVLRLGTTTSTDDSGLLAEILPIFEEEYNASVEVIAVGTGQAITLGEAGDVDVLLVHSRSREDAFIEAGHGTARFDVMYNDYILVGPAADPAGIAGTPLAADALVKIAAAGEAGSATFASRGDDSGTHTKEQSLWKKANLTPEGEWYKSLGQGMGDTLRFADETGAYTLADRGTYLSLKENYLNLVVLVGGESISENQDSSLLNPYGVIPVNPDKGGINADLADKFATWLTSLETQQIIEKFGQSEFGQPLFYPDSEAWRNR